MKTMPPINCAAFRGAQKQAMAAHRSQFDAMRKDHLDIVTEAYRAFDGWVKEHDPDGEMDILEQAVAYAEWAETHSIEKYLRRSDDGQS